MLDTACLGLAVRVVSACREGRAVLVELSVVERTAGQLPGAVVRPADCQQAPVFSHDHSSCGGPEVGGRRRAG